MAGELIDHFLSEREHEADTRAQRIAQAREGVYAQLIFPTSIISLTSFNWSRLESARQQQAALKKSFEDEIAKQQQQIADKAADDAAQALKQVEISVPSVLA